MPLFGPVTLQPRVLIPLIFTEHPSRSCSKFNLLGAQIPVKLHNDILQTDIFILARGFVGLRT